MGKTTNTNPPEATRWKPGESGNPNGRPKGSKNLATLVKELENENFDWSLVPIKQKDAAKKIGSPWKAIVFSALAKAYSGDVKAMEWLRKSGYGDKLDLTTGGQPFQVIVEDVYAKQPKFRPDNQTAEADEVAEDSSSA